MPTHSSILAWKTPWTEEPGGLQSMGLPRIGHNIVCTCVSMRAHVHAHTHTHTHTHTHSSIWDINGRDYRLKYGS